MAAHEREIRIERTEGGAWPTRGMEEASFGELLRKLADDSADLIRQEAELVKLEMKEAARAITMDLVKIGVALGIAGVGGLALTAFLILVLGNLLDGAYWASSLIVGGVFLLIGGLLAYSGIKDLKKRSFKPEETIETLKEDRDWAKREAQELRRDLTA